MVSAPAPRLLTAPTYLPALTGIRAVAAYLVYLHHFNPFPPDSGHGLVRLLHRVAVELHVGVPVFFVLSGFLITLRYYGTQQPAGRWWGRYLRNRAARIYPLYFLLTCLSFAALYRAQHRFDLSVWWYNVTFLRGFFDEYKFTGIRQGWTLTVEECFYLLAPLVFAVVQRQRRALWLLPVLLLGAGLALVLVLGPLRYHGLFGNTPFMLLYTFFGRSTEFFVGIQLALWYRNGQLRVPAMRLTYTAAGALGAAAVVAGLVALQGAPYSYGQHHPLGIVLNNVVLPGALAVGFAGLLTEETGFRRFLRTAPMQVLGKSSYAFYLVHLGFAQETVQNRLTSHQLGQFVALNVLAVGLYYGLEQPLQRRLRAPAAP
ncbi:acyltransferase [Hymenobacter koreensis]|uniref:Acyltransferase n=1 Tax=Hymenobacter koreensis TaxID=1084523 RepID=A0ABP8IV07_9BACT